MSFIYVVVSSRHGFKHEPSFIRSFITNSVSSEDYAEVLSPRCTQIKPSGDERGMSEKDSRK